MAILQLQKRNEKNKLINAGTIEIKNKTKETADLYFYGDIVSDNYITEWEKEAQCPRSIADFLDSLENVKRIDVYFNSAGGDVFAGLAIAKQLKRYKAEKVGHIDGIAASIAGVMLVESCDTIITPKNGMFMLHKPISSCYGNADDLQKKIEILNQCQSVILMAYMSKVKIGVTEEQITEMINAETWLTGEEMAQYFEVQLEEELQVVASCNSGYYDYYKNLPCNLKNKLNEKTEEEIEKIANLIAEKLENIINKKTEETKKEREKRKQKILEGLE